MMPARVRIATAVRLVLATTTLMQFRSPGAAAFSDALPAPVTVSSGWLMQDVARTAASAETI